MRPAWAQGSSGARRRKQAGRRESDTRPPGRRNSSLSRKAAREQTKRFLFLSDFLTLKAPAANLRRSRPTPVIIIVADYYYYSSPLPQPGRVVAQGRRFAFGIGASRRRRRPRVRTKIDLHFWQHARAARRRIDLDAPSRLNSFMPNRPRLRATAAAAAPVSPRRTPFSAPKRAKSNNASNRDTARQVAAAALRVVPCRGVPGAKLMMRLGRRRRRGPAGLAHKLRNLAPGTLLLVAQSQLLLHSGSHVARLK